MDPAFMPLYIAIVITVLVMIIILIVFAITKVKQGNALGALMGLLGFLAGMTYEMNRLISYGLIAIIVILVIIQFNRIIKKQSNKNAEPESSEDK